MLCWDGKPLKHTRRKVIMDHSILIDNALTQNAADILLLPPHECSSHASCLQKEKDLIKILGRMDRQIAGIDATMSPGSKVTAQILYHTSTCISPVLLEERWLWTAGINLRDFLQQVELIGD